jgi:hypothetical protein
VRQRRGDVEPAAGYIRGNPCVLVVSGEEMVDMAGPKNDCRYIAVRPEIEVVLC